MHRLRNKKKGKTDEDVPPLPSISTSFLKRHKEKPAPEQPNMEEKIENALPSQDEFRTSLLMPNLANRFSLLKEQEAAAAAAAAAAAQGKEGAADPGTSTMRHSSLGDIAETESTHGSIQSSNRYTTRSDEGQGRPSEDGSMMSRGRGGDGNVLFGGRQKVYKVSNRALRREGNSMEELRSESPIGSGRVLYEPDVRETHSASRWRAKYRDDDSLKINTETDENSEYNKNRFTSSSTNSTPASYNNARMSTAATSINSQAGPHSARSVPQSPTGTSGKPRKPLYEQALEDQLQAQQSTAVSRLERFASLSRVRSNSPPPARTDSPFGNRLHGTAPSSPLSTRAMPWSPNANSTTTPISAMPPFKREESSQSDVQPHSPLDKFDFGLGLSPRPPPVKTPESPILGSRPGSSDEPESPILAHPLTPRHQPMATSNIGSRSRASSISSVSSLGSERDGMDHDRAIRELEEELGSDNRDSTGSAGSFGTRKTKAHAALSLSRSGHSSSTDLSKGSDVPEGRLPFRNPQLSAISPVFTANIYDVDKSDSPTLPPQDGLSSLVRQHLRSDSGSSSIYADSMYTKKSRLSRLSRYIDVPPPLPNSDFTQNGQRPLSAISTDANGWQDYGFEGTPFDADHKNENRGDSPTSIYPPTIHAPPSPPPPVPSVPLPKVPGGDDNDNDGGSPTSIYPPTIHAPPSPPPAMPPLPKIPRNGSRPGSSAASSLGPRSRSNSGNDDDVSPIKEDSERGWEEELAYRRQIIQQNLRNQEKIYSRAQDMHWENGAKSPPAKGPNGALHALRAKTSNGFLKGEKGTKNGHSGSRPGTAKSAHEGPMSPSRQAPASLGQHPGLRGQPLRALDTEGGQFGAPHTPKSPMVPSQYLQQKDSRDRMSPTPKLQPSWNDLRGRGVQPPTPVTPSTMHDDLSRAMMTGQSQADAEAIVPIRRPGLSRNVSTEDVKSVFEIDKPRRGLIRSRANSILSPSPSSSDLTKIRALQEPRAAPSIPNSPVADHSGEERAPRKPINSELIRTIHSSVSQYQPARKRAVSKHKISTPTLISTTNKTACIDLPPVPAIPPTVPMGRPRRKTGTFGFRRSSEAENNATGVMSDNEVEKPRKLNKLRKSTSAGEALNASARRAEAEAMAGSMPRLAGGKKVVSPPMRVMPEPVAVGPGGEMMI